MEEKISMLTGVVTGVTSAFLSPDISVPYLGVPLNVVGAALAGAFCSFAFGAAVRPRGRLFKLAMACAVLGVAILAVLTELIGVNIAEQKQAPLALVFSAMMRWIVPAFQHAVPKAMNEWLRPKRRDRWGEDYGDDRFNEPTNRREDDGPFDR